MTVSRKCVRLTVDKGYYHTTSIVMNNFPALQQSIYRDNLSLTLKSSLVKIVR